VVAVVAVTAVKAALEWPDGNPAERLALVALCEAVNEQRLQAGYPWEAWLSQGNLAALVGVTARQVRRLLTALEETYGVIADTGARRGRGVVVWEVLGGVLGPRTPVSTPDTSVLGGSTLTRPSADPHPTPSGASEIPPPSTDSAPSGTPPGAPRGADPGHQRPGGRTSGAPTPDTSVRSPRTPASAEPEGNRTTEEPENEHGSTAPPAAIDASDFQSTLNGKISTYYGQDDIDAMRGLLTLDLPEASRNEITALLGEMEQEREGETASVAVAA
jgi:hypothetical protein